MSEMQKYYEILGLNPGASQETIRQAYRDLVSVWHPDRFPNNPRLREKATEKLKQINLAYERLKSRIDESSDQYTKERRSRRESQPPPHEPPPKKEKKQSSTGDAGGHKESKPPPKEPPLNVSDRPVILWFVIAGLVIALGSC